MTLNISLWIAQILLAAFLILGAIMKFMPIEKTAEKMPWMGQVPAWSVRALGLLDLAAGVGLILPTLLLIYPSLTAWTAVSVIVYMICASIFHIMRGESKVIGFNIFLVILAAFIAWGRF